MFSKTMTNRMKAAAIAALMCLSAAGAAVPMLMTSTMDIKAAAVSVGKKMEAGATYKGDFSDLKADEITELIFTVKAPFTGNVSFGLGVSTQTSPYWLELDGKSGKWVDTSDKVTTASGTNAKVTANKEVQIKVDASKIDIKSTGTFEFRNYYSADWSSGDEVESYFTLVSVEAVTGSAEETTETTEEATKDPDATEETTEAVETTEATEPEALNEKLGVKDVFTGYWADYAESGVKNLAITFTADFTGTVNFGIGTGLSEKPWWNEYDGKTKAWIDTKDGTVDAAGITAKVEEGKEYVVVYDTSKIKLSYTPKDEEYPGRFEFRNYDVSEKGGTITVTDVEVNTKKESTIESPESSTEDEHSLSKKDGSKSANKTTGEKWSFTDNKDGTGTLTATLARQQEFPKSPLTLTRGFDEEYYAKEDKTPVEGKDKLNAHKFAYNTFGLNDVGRTQTVESLLVTITSDGHPLKNFMYGGGLNVEDKSPADTEAAKAAKGQAISDDAGYWYNDMGQDKIKEYEAAGVEFGVTPCFGYFLSAEDNPLGEYFSVYWDVPEEVQPYERTGDISFQYWYGVEDTGEDEKHTEIDEVDLVGGVITYTQAQTFQYGGVETVKVDEKIKEGKTSTAINYKDLGLKPWNEVKAMVFTLDVGSDLDKLVYGVGTSVGEDFKMFSPEDENWDYVMLNTKKGEVEIVWYVPTGIVPNVEYGNFQFGYWYGGNADSELADVTLKSVDVYYADGVEPTDPPTEAPTEAPTEPTTEATTEASTETTTEELIEPFYGDVNVDQEVNIMDVIALNKYLVGVKELSKQGLLNADVNVNNDVSSDDSLNILKCCLDIIKQTDFPLSK